MNLRFNYTVQNNKENKRNIILTDIENTPPVYSLTGFIYPDRTY
ncbi:hypothetical protein PAECIP111894_02116 [Paenibacillus pseudetheri]|uniref:Uncharacterized protein n=1 Tax=Paenibacillus pseudetheri TaxID=2897682 RepID=A0ABN8FCZ0_9BACL|nr:hypothetical protein PAECIP111894_02116 [Paenibacillus pseudetheri]